MQGLATNMVILEHIMELKVKNHRSACAYIDGLGAASKGSASSGAASSGAASSEDPLLPPQPAP